MAVRSILRYPAPELRIKSEPVSEMSQEVRALVGDLIETLEASPGTVGIAAPQIGVARRVVVVDASRYRKKVPCQGRIVMINPVLTSASGRGIFREGCLSLPDYTANVPRATSVRYDALDTDGYVRAIEANGFEAVVFQHEVDHLDGILFIDRVECLTTDLFLRRR